MRTFHVYRSGRTWGVYVQPGSDGTGQELVEGGFFFRHAAVAAKEEWEAEHDDLDSIYDYTDSADRG